MSDETEKRIKELEEAQKKLLGALILFEEQVSMQFENLIGRVGKNNDAVWKELVSVRERLAGAAARIEVTREDTARHSVVTRELAEELAKDESEKTFVVEKWKVLAGFASAVITAVLAAKGC